MAELSDVAAETGLIAGVMQNGLDSYLDIADLVTAGTLTGECHQVIWRCLGKIYEEGKEVKVDLPLVMSVAQGLGLKEFLDRPTELKQLQAMLRIPVRPENVRRFAGKVRKLEFARLMQGQLAQSQYDLSKLTGDESISHILGLVQDPIFDLSTTLTDTTFSGPRSIGTDIREYVQFLIDHPDREVGLSTNFGRFDEAIGGGLRPGAVDVVGARTGVGKTQFKINVGLFNAIKKGIKVLDLDTEMTREQIHHRILARLSGVSLRDIERGRFAHNTEGQKKVKQAAEWVHQKGTYFWESIGGWPFEETLAYMRRWISKEVGLDENGHAKPCLILFDYIKLMDGAAISRNLSEFQALGFLMTGLHNFMVRYKVPCLALVQLNRDGITVEDTSVMSGSDRIVWLCSSFSILKEKDEDEVAEGPLENRKYNLKLVPLKTRHGEGLSRGDYINIQFEKKIAKMTEGPTKLEALKQQKSTRVINGSAEGSVVLAESEDSGSSFSPPSGEDSH